MARQTVNTGSSANDGTGDTLRTAGVKINANFAELYQLLGGDSAGTGSTVTTLTDSGLDFIGASFKTKIGFAAPASELNIDFPDSSGAVIIDAATQTMTNKTLTQPNIDSATIDRFSFKDADSSHVYKFIPSNLAADRNVVLPLLGGDDTLVMEAHTQTLTNKTLTSPSITTPNITTSINDANGAESIKLTATGSAVDEITIANAATNSGTPSNTAPSITASGSDTNINLSVAGKGTGCLLVGKTALSAADINSTSTASQTVSYIRSTASTTITATIADGITVGEVKVITHKGSSVTTVTPTNFAQGTSIALDADDTVSLIWDGNEWNVIGGFGYTVS